MNWEPYQQQMQRGCTLRWSEMWPPSGSLVRMAGNPGAPCSAH
jgi:hypothetical protein